jgi:hypothetical protein
MQSNRISFAPAELETTEGIVTSVVNSQQQQEGRIRELESAIHTMSTVSVSGKNGLPLYSKWNVVKDRASLCVGHRPEVPFSYGNDDPRATLCPTTKLMEAELRVGGALLNLSQLHFTAVFLSYSHRMELKVRMSSPLFSNQLSVDLIIVPLTMEVCTAVGLAQRWDSVVFERLVFVLHERAPGAAVHFVRVSVDACVMSELLFKGIASLPNSSLEV